MAKHMRTITFGKRSRADVLHIEAPGCIVNIQHSLHNMEGDEVTSVQVVADQYADEPKATLPDVFSLSDVVKVFEDNYGLFDTLSTEQTESFIREKLTPATSYNVRVVRHAEKKA